MNGYNLLRDWYNYKFAHPSKVKAVHSDMYCYLIDLWNRLGQKNEFGLPTQVTMEALGIGSYNTYKKTFDDLIEFGFVKLVADSKNQYQSRIIALSKNDKASDEATDKALDKAHIKATDIIDKQITNNNNKLSSTEDPWQGGCVDPTEDPWQQEKEKEEVKEKVKEQIDFQALLDFINLNFKREFKVINKKVKAKYQSLLSQGYLKQNITTAILNCKNNQYHKEKNYQYCTPEFFSRTDTIDKYGFSTTEIQEVYNPPIIHE